MVPALGCRGNVVAGNLRSDRQPDDLHRSLPCPIRRYVRRRGIPALVERQLLWDKRGIIAARDIAKMAKSPNPREKTGAIVFDSKHRQVGAGYEGLPSELRDLPERMANKELRTIMQLSAVDWALHQAGDRARGGTVYTWPVAPRVRDALLIIRAGCARVVYGVHSQWEEAPNLTARALLEEAGVKCIATGDL